MNLNKLLHSSRHKSVTIDLEKLSIDSKVGAYSAMRGRFFLVAGLQMQPRS